MTDQHREALLTMGIDPEDPTTFFADFPDPYDAVDWFLGPGWPRKDESGPSTGESEAVMAFADEYTRLHFEDPVLEQIYP